MIASCARSPERYRGYGWETNVGYATREHGAAILKLGPTPHHRRSFAPVRLALAGELSLFASLSSATCRKRRERVTGDLFHQRRQCMLAELSDRAP